MISDTSSIYSEEMGDLTNCNDIGIQNLICPLCLKFLYKCTTTICGHSFCERCIDEYLIIRKVYFKLTQQIVNIELFCLR
jgi:hypothetical protein